MTEDERRDEREDERRDEREDADRAGERIGDGSGERARDRAADWERRRRLAEVFGDVLPETTRDERDPGAGRDRGSGEDPADRWLKEQVPPHHG